MGASWGLKLTELLLSQGANMEAKNNQGQTPLHLAVKPIYGSMLIIKLLVQYGANINAKDKNGQTPLILVRKQLAEAKEKSDPVDKKFTKSLLKPSKLLSKCLSML